MTKITSLSLNDETSAILEPRVHESTGGRSGAISTIVARYAEICRRELPGLSEAEMNLVRDALNGAWLVDRPEGIQTMLWAEVTDAIKLNQADTKHGVDGAALVEKLRGLTYAQAVALVDSVERWWLEDRS